MAPTTPNHTPNINSMKNCNHGNISVTMATVCVCVCARVCNHGEKWLLLSVLKCTCSECLQHRLTRNLSSELTANASTCPVWQTIPGSPLRWPGRTQHLWPDSRYPENKREGRDRGEIEMKEQKRMSEDYY